MADKTPEGAVRLDETTKKRLAEIEPGMAEARRAMEVMKKLGMDTSAIEDKLVWAEEVRKTLLREFSD